MHRPPHHHGPETHTGRLALVGDTLPPNTPETISHAITGLNSAVEALQTTRGSFDGWDVRCNEVESVFTQGHFRMDNVKGSIQVVIPRQGRDQSFSVRTGDQSIKWSEQLPTPFGTNINVFDYFISTLGNSVTRTFTKELYVKALGFGPGERVDRGVPEEVSKELNVKEINELRTGLEGIMTARRGEQQRRHITSAVARLLHRN